MPESSPTFMQPEPQPAMVERHGFINRLKQHPFIASASIATASALGFAGCGGGNVLESNDIPTTTGASAGETFATAAVTTTTGEAVVCAKTWVVEQANNDGNRWFANGIEEIANADTDSEARDAFDAWLHEVKKDPDLLAGAAAILIDKEVNAEELADGKCASDLADQIAAEIEIAVGVGDVKPSEAPANGHNTGTNSNGEVVAAEQSGISGDRKAILVITINGKKVYVMFRCGNVVTEDATDLPKGPTDETPATTTTVSYEIPTTTEAPDKPPVTLPGPHDQPGDGGEQGEHGEPGCDSPVTDYCEGQQPNPPTTAEEAPATTYPATAPTTGEHTATTQEPITAPTYVSTTAPDGPPPTNVP